MCVTFAFTAAALCATTALAGTSTITVHTAGAHPMRYHVALPVVWSAERGWPVPVAIPDASR